MHQLFPKDKFLDMKLLGERTCTFKKCLIYTSNFCNKVCNHLHADQQNMSMPACFSTLNRKKI